MNAGGPMNTATRILTTMGAAFTVATAGMSLPAPPAAAADGYRWAIEVDGDTISIVDGPSVRLLGYDTPEEGQCGYSEATARMAALVQRPVKLYNKSGRDAYGRVLAYVKTRNGRDIGSVMLRRGLAVARYDRLDGYPWHPKQDLYRTLDSTNGEIVCDEVDPEPAYVPTPMPTVITPIAPSVSVSYDNCDAVRAAGAAPIYLGQPGYGPHLDRDGDGVGCE